MSASESAATPGTSPEPRQAGSGHYSGRAGHPGPGPDRTGNRLENAVSAPAALDGYLADPVPRTETLARSVDDPPACLVADERDGLPVAAWTRPVVTVDPGGLL